MLFWWVYDNRQPRYALGVLVFLFPLAAWAIGLTKARARKAYDRILAFCVVVMLAVVSSKMLVEFGDRIILSKMYTRSAFYEYPQVVDSLAPGATILNMATRSANYPLFGRANTNRVVGYRKTRRLLGSDTLSGGTPTALSTNSDRLSGGAPPAPSTDDDATTDAMTYVLRTPVLRRLRATHAYVLGSPEIRSDGCSSLREVGRLDTNPVNGIRLPRPRVLYAIIYCVDSGGVAR